MGLATPEKIRTLQRKLYVKAKGDDTRSPGGGPDIQATWIAAGELGPVRLQDRLRMSRLHP